MPRYKVEDLAMSIQDLAQVQEEIQQNENVSHRTFGMEAFRLIRGTAYWGLQWEVDKDMGKRMKTPSGWGGGGPFAEFLPYIRCDKGDTMECPIQFLSQRWDRKTVATLISKGIEAKILDLLHYKENRDLRTQVSCSAEIWLLLAAVLNWQGLMCPIS